MVLLKVICWILTGYSPKWFEIGIENKGKVGYYSV
jgi:hypothetical protein